MFSGFSTEHILFYFQNHLHFHARFSIANKFFNNTLNSNNVEKAKHGFTWENRYIFIEFIMWIQTSKLLIYNVWEN